MFMSPQIMKSSLGVYRDCRIVSNWSKISAKFTRRGSVKYKMSKCTKIALEQFQTFFKLSATFLNSLGKLLKIFIPD